MNSNFKRLNQKLDLAGALERDEERIQKREQERQAQAEVNEAAEAYRAALARVRKQEQEPQHLTIDVAACERGLYSYDAQAAYRVIDLKKLRDRDPAAFAFLVQNSSIETA